MSIEQFPHDEVDGQSRIIIYMWTASLDTHAGAELADRVSGIMSRTLTRLEGFVEGAVFESDDGKGVVAMARWKTRHAWARAEWDLELNKMKADLALAGITTSDGMYYEHARISAAQAG